MNVAPACGHCLLPIGRLAQRREVGGEPRVFCCYGCCLAYQVHHGEREEPEAAALLIRLGVGAFLAMNIMLFSLLLYSGTFGAADGWMVSAVHWLLWILATPLLVVLGGPFLRGAWQAARQRRVGTDTLVAIGALAAYGYSAVQVVTGGGEVYFDTATMVLVLFVLGRYLDAQGRVRAIRSLAPMLAAERAQARVVTDGVDMLRPMTQVRPGDLVRILPGECIPVDGTVVEGRSDCDESILTGQPQPQAKAPGAPVHAGSLNGRGQLLLRATAAGSATRWAQIGRMVREALAEKSSLANMVDRLAAIFVPGVILLALATVWFWSGREPFGEALLTGLAVLVVACPCSLGLAAPLATTLGIALAAQRGILIRSGRALENLARVRAIAFDKTATLTAGQPRVAQLLSDASQEQEMLCLATALAKGSEHPLARAVIALGRERGIDVAPAREVEAHPGAGVAGCVDGRPVAMGSAAFIAGLGWEIPPQWRAAAALPEHTLVYVGWSGRAHGVIALADPLLAEAVASLAALRERGLTLLLLSGDREPVVARTAAALGIPLWRAQLLPEGKVSALREWTAAHGPIAMVGDGLNDGPVLAAAAVGIAVGRAADLARESADVVLPERALEALPWLLHAAAQVRRSIVANLGWALGYNAIALGLAVAGLLQPIVAAALMAGSSVLVVGRSLRANRRYARGAAVREREIHSASFRGGVAREA
jgi:Cu2+-exporting ATPase